MTVKVLRDRSVTLDGEIVGTVFGEPRNWGFMLADYRKPARTPSMGWHSKQEAADMCARAHRETPQTGRRRGEAMTGVHLGCPSPDCEYKSAEFWLLTDGTIICADDECHAVFGHWERPERLET